MLKPCPFCGGKQIGTEYDYNGFSTLYGNYYAYCYCKECGSRGERKPYIDEAKDAWNRRANDVGYAEYIERKKDIEETRKPRLTDAELRRSLALIPAAEVRPVVRGRWTEIHVDDIGESVSVASMRCDQCGLYHNEVYFYGAPTENVNFCPNCGAKMGAET